jgi:hypothetical protein
MRLVAIVQVLFESLSHNHVDWTAFRKRILHIEVAIVYTLRVTLCDTVTRRSLIIRGRITMKCVLFHFQHSQRDAEVSGEDGRSNFRKNLQPETRSAM